MNELFELMLKNSNYVEWKIAMCSVWPVHGALKFNKITLMQCANVSKDHIVCICVLCLNIELKWDVHRIMKFICNDAGFSVCFFFYCLLDCSILFLSLYKQIWQTFPTDHAPRLKSFEKCGNDYRLLHTGF